MIPYQRQCFHAPDLLAIGQLTVGGTSAHGSPPDLRLGRESVDGGGQRVPLLENALLRNGQLAPAVSSTHVKLHRGSWRVIRRLLKEQVAGGRSVAQFGQSGI